MSSTFKLKRTSTPGAIPATLLDGELAINIPDGKLFLKKTVASVDTIIEVGAVKTVAGRAGDVVLAKADVGLSSVDNTSDANKPISTTAQAALDAKAPLASPALTGTPTAPTAVAGTSTTQIASTAFATTAIAVAISNLINSAPGALDTLNELATALGDDPNFATTMTNALALKAPLASPALTGVPAAPTATPGTNTTQLATTAFVAALGALKAANGANADITSLTGLTTALSVGQGGTGKTTALVKADVGLASADNTSDVGKPVSTAQQTALNLKVDTSLLAAASGVATLDASGKLLPAQVPASLSGVAVSDLANTSTSTLGSAMVGRVSQAITSFADLRALKTTAASKYAEIYGSGWLSVYHYDATDTTSAENIPLIVLATDGGRWKLNHNGVITALQCGLVNDGTTLNTATTLNAVNAAVTSAGARLFWNAGTFLCEAITVLASQYWEGESSTTTILKAKNSLNADFISAGTGSNVDEVTICNLQINGNRANNTTGTSLRLKGARPNVRNLIITQSAENGLNTDYDTSTALRANGFEGHFSDIVIDTTGKSGWAYNGPNDSAMTNITLIDNGLSADNSYYGLYITQSCRADNVHPWNRSTATNTPTAGVYVNAPGTTIVNSHFEGSHCPLKIVSNQNSVSSSHFYATRGLYCLEVYGAANKISGVMGDTAFSGNLNYIGVFLSGADNQIEVTDGGCVNGAINFSGSTGGNFIRVSGYRASGVPFTGTPASNDDVLLMIQGAGGGELVQNFPATWTAGTFGVTAGSGSLTNATCTYRYKTTGKRVDVQYTINIVTNGTGASFIQVPLPGGFTASAFVWQLVGRSSASGGVLQGNIQASANYVRIFDYTNAYPGASGAVLTLNGSFERA